MLSGPIIAPGKPLPQKKDCKVDMLSRNPLAAF
jgi:hypothetical protein